MWLLFELEAEQEPYIFRKEMALPSLLALGVKQLRHATAPVPTGGRNACDARGDRCHLLRVVSKF